jgi:multimeric flavodoxin WrbA
MPPKVLGIVGSYRRDGIIDQVVSEVLAAAGEAGAEVEKVFLLDRNIEFCTNCRRCTQVDGPDPGPCSQGDDMAALIAAIEGADALVLGSPVNFGGVNALTQRFIERLVGYAFWPWGQPAPKPRRAGKPRKRAVLVTSTAMPAFMARFATGAMRTLKLAVGAVGARPIATLYAGKAAAERPIPTPGLKNRARRAGHRLAEKNR